MSAECENIRELLYDYAEGRLLDEQAERVREHIFQCDKCRAEHDGICDLLSEMRSLESNVPSVLLSTVMNAVGEYEKENKKAAQRHRFTGFGSMAAAFLVVVICTVFIMPRFIDVDRNGNSDNIDVYMGNNGAPENYENGGGNPYVPEESKFAVTRTDGNDEVNDGKITNVPTDTEESIKDIHSAAPDSEPEDNDGTIGSVKVYEVYRADKDSYKRFEQSNTIEINDVFLGYAVIEKTDDSVTFANQNATKVGLEYNKTITSNAELLIDAVPDNSKKSFIVVIFE